MRYEAKAIIIGRKKKIDDSKEGRPCFVSLFDENNPHRSGKVPKEILDFEGIHKVIIRGGLDVDYLLEGNDVLINNLKSADIESDGDGHLLIKGSQERIE